MIEPTVPPASSGVPVRDASSVLLLRDDPESGRPSVWMLTRVTGMVFAAGASVFAGGRVDASDGDLPWAGRAPEVFAAELECDVDLARALVGAAVRETFEETGVLLTVPPASLAHLQEAVEGGALTFAQLLAENGLAIDADALRPWAHWVTPDGPGARRRYDTRFFIAALPPDAEAADLTTESTIAEWTTPTDALAAADRRERSLMTPTRMVLRSIEPFDSVEAIIAGAAGRSLAAVRPVVEVDADGVTWAVLPDGTRDRVTDPGEARPTP
jgi:8-oxo-dGTP pyrophosphatase MutT (NUDIX family)